MPGNVPVTNSKGPFNKRLLPRTYSARVTILGQANFHASKGISMQDFSGKVQEVIKELKRTGLWKNEIPGWVCRFEYLVGKDNDAAFTEWLQFIYLPNCELKNESRKNDIAMQAARFLGSDPSKERLLQLLIELDALK